MNITSKGVDLIEKVWPEYDKEVHSLINFVPKEKQDNQGQSNQQPKQQNTYQPQELPEINISEEECPF